MGDITRFIKLKPSYSFISCLDILFQDGIEKKKAYIMDNFEN